MATTLHLHPGIAHPDIARPAGPDDGRHSDRRPSERPAIPLTARVREETALPAVSLHPRRVPGSFRKLRWGAISQPMRAEHVLWRPIEIVLATGLLVAFAPMFILVAMVIWVADPGPVLFSHRRIGRKGRKFSCLKFRSMYVGAEDRLATLVRDDPALREIWNRDHKLPDDPRVTAVGKILRVTSLDELPQLFNVLKGDMSLVGPRPIIVAEALRYGRYIHHYCAVRPGLTGLWQVSGRSATTYRRRVAADVKYARVRNMGMDMRILAATVPAVISGRGSC